MISVLKPNFFIRVSVAPGGGLHTAIFGGRPIGTIVIRHGRVRRYPVLTDAVRAFVAGLGYRFDPAAAPGKLASSPAQDGSLN